MKRGFDNKLYLKLQTQEILKRLNLDDRLYLEIGGHITYDGHASRVLPGYNPKNKIKILKKLKDIEIIYCINSKDIESKKRLGDFNLSYPEQTLRDLKLLKKNKLPKPIIVITRFNGEKKAKEFKNKLETLNYKVFLHKEIPNYLTSLTSVLNGYKKQPYIKTKEKIIIVTGAAGGSGKMATTLCQIYKDRQKKIRSKYAKFETFPIWNLPLNHPINIAYEAATADLQDKNEIDPFHLKAYNKKAVNYNRDIENFKILKKIANKLFPKTFSYKSPTDMGINMAKSAIINNKICQKASIKEIKRRMKEYNKEYKKGRTSIKTIERMKQIMGKINSYSK